MEREMEHMTDSTRNNEKRIFSYLREREAAGLPSPTIEEIRAATGIGSTSTVRKALSNLEDLGKITRMRGQSRSIRTTGGTADECRKVPVMDEEGSESGKLLMIDEKLLDGGDMQAIPGYLFVRSAIGERDYAVIDTERVPQEGDQIVTHEEEGLRLRRYHPYMLEAIGGDDPIMPDASGQWQGGIRVMGTVILRLHIFRAD